LRRPRNAAYFKPEERHFEGHTLSATAEDLTALLSDANTVETDRLAEVLHATKTELARATGLPRDAITRRDRAGSKKTQRRLRDTVEIIHRVTPWAGSMARAFAWFRSQPLPSFGDKTAEDLLKEGRAEAVLAYLSRIADGGYA
jgi:uncharacterized protein (DUF2384 family)